MVVTKNFNMKKVLFAVAFICAHMVSMSQSIEPSETDVKILTDFSPPRTSRPLYFVSIEGREIEFPEAVIFNGDLKINSRSIQSIHVLRDQQAIDKYGDNGKNGVVVIAVEKSRAGLLPVEVRRKFNLD